MPSLKTREGKKAHELCKGVGVEIGALHEPFELDATVLYMDRFDTDGLRESYRGDQRASLIKSVTLVARSLPYNFISDAAFDFVVSSHVLEHFPNPGLAIEEWIRIVKTGGIVFTVIPNKNETFDRPRQLTPISDLMDAYIRRDPDAPLAQYEDYYRNREIAPTAHRRGPPYIFEKWKTQESIHVYTFTPESAYEFLTQLSKMLPFEIIYFESEGMNIIFALRKADV